MDQRLLPTAISCSVACRSHWGKGAGEQEQEQEETGQGDGIEQEEAGWGWGFEGRSGVGAGTEVEPGSSIPRGNHTISSSECRHCLNHLLKDTREVCGRGRNRTHAS